MNTLKLTDIMLTITELSASEPVIGTVTRYRHGPGWFACHGSSEQLECGPEEDVGAERGYRADVFDTCDQAIRWVLRMARRERRRSIMAQCVREIGTGIAIQDRTRTGKKRTK